MKEYDPIQIFLDDAFAEPGTFQGDIDQHINDLALRRALFGGHKYDKKENLRIPVKPKKDIKQTRKQAIVAFAKRVLGVRE
jgi:hypothetical protein